MIYRRGILALALCSMLGMMAFGFAGAQAQEFKIEGKTFKELGIKSESINGSLEGFLKLLILKLNVIIECTGGTVENITMLPLGEGHGKLTSAECKALDHEGNELPCTSHSPITAGGRALLISHNGKIYGLLEPESGTTFMVKKWLGEFCTLPQEANLKGSVVGEIGQSDLLTHLINAEPGTLALFPSSTLFYGSHVIHVTGSVTAALTGVNAGKKWGVL